MNDIIEKTAELFKALAEPNRLRIVMMLRVRPMCVCEITSVLGLDQSTVSRHLAKLKSAGLIADERRGQWVDFRLVRQKRDSPASRVIKLLSSELEDSNVIRNDVEKAKRADRGVLCRR
jgi:DNA-binding transcriptional ArsR family regulator